MVQTMGMDMLQYRIRHQKVRRTASRQAATDISGRHRKRCLPYKSNLSGRAEQALRIRYAACRKQITQGLRRLQVSIRALQYQQMAVIE